MTAHMATIHGIRDTATPALSPVRDTTADTCEHRDPFFFSDSETLNRYTHSVKAECWAEAFAMVANVLPEREDNDTSTGYEFEPDALDRLLGQFLSRYDRSVSIRDAVHE